MNPPEQFNYFNYFTEIEEEFVRRRGKPLFISPMDWALIESWKNAGIPLHLVLRAINEAFDAYEARERKFRKVNSMFYCEQTVETMFAEYRLSQVGASTPTPTSTASTPAPEEQSRAAASQAVFPKAALREFLDRSFQELAYAENAAREQQKTALVETLKRARKRLRGLAEEIDQADPVNEQALEHDLDGIDRLILKTIKDSLADKQRQAIEEEADAHLKSYKRKMDKKIFEQTLQNFISRRLRETHKIPRLSLFYI
ncbi:MAG: hypothetical protein HY231_20630 [Acidobacteria bacterium]|nr:hypothetical protein [Acidobacteriota bacterium]